MLRSIAAPEKEEQVQRISIAINKIRMVDQMAVMEAEEGT
jgi:hypothetical protein